MRLYYGHLKHPIAKSLTFETMSYYEKPAKLGSFFGYYGAPVKITQRIETSVNYFICPLDVTIADFDMRIAQNKNSKRRLSFDLSKEDVEKAIESLTVSNPVNRRMAHKFTLVLDDGSVLDI